jgi:hypothetical protein
MSEQNLGERVIPTDSEVKNYQVTNSLLDNSDLFADRVTVDPALIHETPMGATVASVGPLNASPADGFTTVAAPLREIPMAEPVYPAAPLGETFVRNEKVPYTAPVVETLAADAPVDDMAVQMAPQTETITHDPIVSNTGSLAALLNREESEHLRMRWNEIQGKFVDEPRTAVQQADALVSDVIGQITQMFASEHSALEGQWKEGNDVSTEDLRKALQRYRSFFNRLVV